MVCFCKLETDYKYNHRRCGSVNTGDKLSLINVMNE